MDSSTPRLAWVRKHDGRLVPFAADKISQALFAASETAGRPDAFMARELTDSILHFLGPETGGAIPTTELIADLVIKVVRELGQPALARAFADSREARSRQAGGQRDIEPASVKPLGPSLAEVSQWAESGLAPAELAWRAAGAALRDYSLRKVFTRNLVAAHADGLLQLSGLETPLELAGSVLGKLPVHHGPG